MNFDEHGNIMFITVQAGRVVAHRPRDGTTHEIPPEWTIVRRDGEQTDAEPHERLILTAHHDAAANRVVGEPCKTCGVTLHVIMRLGDDNTFAKVCMRGHRLV